MEDVPSNETILDIIDQALNEHDIDHEYNCDSIYILDSNGDAVTYINIGDCENENG